MLIQSSFNHKDFSESRLKDFYIREAISFIERNYAENISVEDIAVFCNLNRSYLGKIFREELNKTPQQFLIYYRMNRAAELLKFSDMAVGEVGKLVGYPNQLHFSRAFKSIFEIPPTVWRDQNRLHNPRGSD
jgi:AraC-like DNA-binding protein